MQWYYIEKAIKDQKFHTVDPNTTERIAVTPISLENTNTPLSRRLYLLDLADFLFFREI